MSEHPDPYDGGEPCAYSLPVILACIGVLGLGMWVILAAAHLGRPGVLRKATDGSVWRDGQQVKEATNGRP